jgi:hypothetical protein
MAAMSQHYLLSAKDRTLLVRKVMELTDDQAFALSRVKGKRGRYPLSL